MSINRRCKWCGHIYIPGSNCYASPHGKHEPEPEHLSDSQRFMTRCKWCGHTYIPGSNCHASPHGKHEPDYR